MTQTKQTQHHVKPRVASGQVRRAVLVEVALHLEDGSAVVVRVSKAEALRALRRAKGKVSVDIPFGDGCLILG